MSRHLGYKQYVRHQSSCNTHEIRTLTQFRRSPAQ